MEGEALGRRLEGRLASQKFPVAEKNRHRQSGVTGLRPMEW
jgi:hypothetical protein